MKRIIYYNTPLKDKQWETWCENVPQIEGRFTGCGIIVQRRGLSPRAAFRKAPASQ